MVGIGSPWGSNLGLPNRSLIVCSNSSLIKCSNFSASSSTFSRISGLVTKVINNKFIDTQLNNCDITLANLEEIQKSFITTLAGIHHSRIEYPEDKEEN